MKLSKFAVIVAILLGGSGLLISCGGSGPTLVSEPPPPSSGQERLSPDYAGCVDPNMKDFESSPPPAAPPPVRKKAPSTEPVQDSADCILPELESDK